jgi:hypothetical protein
MRRPIGSDCEYSSHWRGVEDAQWTSRQRFQSHLHLPAVSKRQLRLKEVSNQEILPCQQFKLVLSSLMIWNRYGKMRMAERTSFRNIKQRSRLCNTNSNTKTTSVWVIDINCAPRIHGHIHGFRYNQAKLTMKVMTVTWKSNWRFRNLSRAHCIVISRAIGDWVRAFIVIMIGIKNWASANLQSVGTMLGARVRARDFTRRSCHLFVASRSPVTHLKHFEACNYSNTRQWR